MARKYPSRASVGVSNLEPEMARNVILADGG
jgi:hypothetical protein